MMRHSFAAALVSCIVLGSYLPATGAELPDRLSHKVSLVAATKKLVRQPVVFASAYLPHYWRDYLILGIGF
jgi:hypothetical protein